MTPVQRFFDVAMASLWLVTYILVLISTVYNKYPAISPLTQALIAPLEFAVVIRRTAASSKFTYVSAAYILWSVVELAILFFVIKYGYLKKRHLPFYISFIIALTAVMYYCTGLKNGMTYSNYLITIPGVILWLIYILRSDYRFCKLNLSIFIVKQIADLCCFPPYFGVYGIDVDIMIIMLPAIDFLFIVTYFCKKRLEKKADGSIVLKKETTI